MCNGFMSFYPDKEGGDLKGPGTIKCDNGSLCPSTEEPYGHGSNAKDAYEVSKQKFRKA